MNRILRFVLALAKTVICWVRIEEASIVVGVRPYRREQGRCPLCGRRCDAYDTRPAPRRWRTLDIGQVKCYLEYHAVRVRCPKHGVHVESVPWARHLSRYTKVFEDRVAWMAVYCTMSAVAEECRIEWKSVGGICRRVWADLEGSCDFSRFAGLRRIGIDETSYKKGHKYLTVVVDHDRGCLIWAGDGLGKEVLGRFFDKLTHEQKMAIEVVTADGAKWIKTLVKAKCPNAEWVMDSFHVVSWMNDALNAVLTEEWQVAKKAAKDASPKRTRAGRPAKGDETPVKARELQAQAKAIKGSRFALIKGKENLSEAQVSKLDGLKRAGSHLFRAWELKEDLRAVFRADSVDQAEGLIDDWLKRACRCRIPQVLEVSRKVRSRRDDIVRAVKLRIGNARVEAINNKVKVTVRMGYGFRNIDNLIGLLMLRCSDVKPKLPGRPPKHSKDVA